MRRLLKWIGIVLGVLVLALVVAAGVLYATATSRLDRVYDIQAESIPIPTDDASLSRGAYLTHVLCVECHRSDLAGDKMFEVPGMVTVYSANLTSGAGGIVDLSDADLIRAMRHGLDQDGTPLLIMPAEILIHWSEEDLGSVIAYLRTLPPVDHEVPTPEIAAPGRVLFQLGMFGSAFPAEYIDHDLPFPAMPEIGANEAYGEYLVSALACTLCHGDNLAGGIVPPNAPPGMIPPSANLTPGGELANWSEDDFMKVLRTGTTPDGEEIEQEHMPWQIYARLTDDDLKALWLYIQSVPAVANAGASS